MIKYLRIGISGLWNIIGIKRNKTRVFSGLQLHRFDTNREYQLLQPAIINSFLVFTTYRDQNQKNWLQVYTSISRLNPHQV